jgi:hypothetical protein
MILKEELDEAKNDSTGWGMGFGFSWAIATLAAAFGVENELAGMGAVSAGACALSVVCGLGYLRCRRTIRAWRDQKRLAAIQAEIKADGGS